MPNEISIQGVTLVTASGDPTNEPKGEPFVPPGAATPSAGAALYVNPSLRLDAGLGLVVIEFRDAGGAITSSIPSQRQLEAYRLHEQPSSRPSGTAPQGQVAGAKRAQEVPGHADHAPTEVSAPHTNTLGTVVAPARKA